MPTATRTLNPHLHPRATSLRGSAERKISWQLSQCLIFSWILTRPISKVAAVFVWVFKTFSFFWHRTQLQSLGSNLAVGISANNVAAEKRHDS
jgi:hypothetical protein